MLHECFHQTSSNVYDTSVIAIVIVVPDMDVIENRINATTATPHPILFRCEKYCRDRPGHSYKHEKPKTVTTEECVDPAKILALTL